MSWIIANMKWIMILCGSLTCSMFYAAIAPQAALESTFGDSLKGPLAEIVVRNWGILITLVGAMLIYGAYHPPSRSMILIVASVGKITFIALVLAYGMAYIRNNAGLVIVIDLLMVLLFSG